MKRKATVVVWLILIAAVIAAGIVIFRSVDDGSKTVDEGYVYRPASIMRAVVAMVEKPDAINVLCADAGSAVYAEFFAAFDLAVVTNDVDKSERFDIIVASGDGDREGLGRLFGRLSDDGVLVTCIDVSKGDVAAFRDAVNAFPSPEYHLWMVEESGWMLVGGRTSRRVALDLMMDVFARDSAYDMLAEAGANAVSDVFACYAGSSADLADAFSGEEMSMMPRPEFFLTTEIPSLDWVVADGVDEDIASRVLAEMRSMQVVRRLVVEGSMQAAAGNSETAVETWARAALRNPNDLFIGARIDRLMRNASALIRFGNLSAAARCYETAIVIRPDDAAAVYNYGLCLKRLGRIELAEQVLKRAGELNK